MSDHFFKTVSYDVEGMSCTNCALGIQRALEKEGFHNVNVDFTNGEVQLEAADEPVYHWQLRG